MKIVIIGPLQCGKTTFIKYLDKQAMCVQAKGRDNRLYTVGMDTAYIKLGAFDISLFGTPGLQRYASMRDMVATGADGIIFLFDALYAQKDSQALSILHSVKKKVGKNIPIIYLANKQDLKDARSPDIIRKQNKIPDHIEVYPCSAKTGLNVKESLGKVVNEVYNRYKKILGILMEYEENIHGLAIRLRKNKREMISLLNKLELKKFIEINRVKRTYRVRELGNVI